MIISRYSIAAVAALSVILCACTEPTSTKPVVPTALFPPAEVCGYPAASAAGALKELAGGTWGPVNSAERGSAFECTGAQMTARMGTDPNSSIEIGYQATGVEKGASLITLTYNATGSGPIPNESTYRRVFTNFVETVSQQSLGGKPHELFRKKLDNLNSYSQPGKASPENFDIGKGFAQLTRETSANNQEVKVTVKLFPDAALKLQ